MRKTKIICTIGPATASYPMLERLYRAGMNVVRLNMSHADHASATKVINWIRTLNRKVRYPVPILLDTQGPEIRTGDLPNDLNLVSGEIISVSVRDKEDVEQSSIHVNYGELVEAVGVGDRITVDNGLINLEVLSKHGGHLTCKVLDGGVLGSKKHVNLPGIRVNLPAITEKDAADIEFGIEQELDFIALSFVRRSEDVIQLRARLGSKANKVKVIAKIEDAEGVSNLEEIIRVSDGVMVARGDLGVEIDLAELPNVQRRIVRLCQEAGKRVIVATHLLESMIANPIPTRAEVTDVANAVYEEVDAVMLSGETSVGKYPVRCVEYLDAIACSSERFPGLGFVRNLRLDSEKRHLAKAAVDLAESIGLKGILVITRRGIMADHVTACHPDNVPIYAFTNDSGTRRRLMLNRHLVSHRTAFSKDPEKTLHTAMSVLVEREGFASGDQVVVLSDVLVGHGVDAIQVRSVP
ncbi:MAG: pyruvate kinase [Gammaproteobacteria bacterium]|nr:MAG: pyruvate kinase [Gammaproteobacteria bacterium]